METAVEAAAAAVAAVAAAARSDGRKEEGTDPCSYLSLQKHPYNPPSTCHLRGQPFSATPRNSKESQNIFLNLDVLYPFLV